MATTRPRKAELECPAPAFEIRSPYTAMPRTTLVNNVTELAEAMAGASTPVLSAACCSAKPVRAERISTQTDQVESSARMPEPTSVTNVFVTAACRPNPSPAAAP